MSRKVHSKGAWLNSYLFEDASKAREESGVDGSHSPEAEKRCQINPHSCNQAANPFGPVLWLIRTSKKAHCGTCGAVQPLRTPEWYRIYGLVLSRLAKVDAIYPHLAFWKQLVSSLTLHTNPLLPGSEVGTAI